MSTTVNSLAPGRELDAVIERDVFKRTWDETRCRMCGAEIVPHPDYPGCWSDNCSMRPIPKGDERADAPGHWSTNTDCAMALVARMIWLLKQDRTAANGWPVHRVKLVYDVAYEGWSANFGGLPVYGSTLPHAICLAALAMMPCLNRKAAGGGV